MPVMSVIILLFSGFCGNLGPAVLVLRAGPRTKKGQVAGGDRWDARSLCRPFRAQQRDRKHPQAPQPPVDSELSILQSLSLI